MEIHSEEHAHFCSGSYSDGNSIVQHLTVVSGNFSLSASHSGFGSGPSAFDGHSAVDDLAIMNGFFDCSALSSTACSNASQLILNEGSIVAIAAFSALQVNGLAHQAAGGEEPIWV
jgi:hypothetical protein